MWGESMGKEVDQCRNKNKQAKIITSILSAQQIQMRFTQKSNELSAYAPVQCQPIHYFRTKLQCRRYKRQAILYAFAAAALKWIKAGC
jgi:hypothetical protein